MWLVARRTCWAAKSLLIGQSCFEKSRWFAGVYKETVGHFSKENCCVEIFDLRVPGNAMFGRGMHIAGTCLRVYYVLRSQDGLLELRGDGWSLLETKLLCGDL